MMKTMLGRAAAAAAGVSVSSTGDSRSLAGGGATQAAWPTIRLSRRDANAPCRAAAARPADRRRRRVPGGAAGAGRDGPDAPRAGEGDAHALRLLRTGSTTRASRAPGARSPRTWRCSRRCSSCALGEGDRARAERHPRGGDRVAAGARLRLLQRALQHGRARRDDPPRGPEPRLEGRPAGRVGAARLAVAARRLPAPRRRPADPVPLRAGAGPARRHARRPALRLPRDRCSTRWSTVPASRRTR